MKLNIYSTTCKVQCDSAESQDWQINMSAVIMSTTVSGYEAAQWSEWKLYSIMKIIYCIYLMSNDSLFMFLCFGVCVMSKCSCIVSDGSGALLQKQV